MSPIHPVFAERRRPRGGALLSFYAFVLLFMASALSAATAAPNATETRRFQIAEGDAAGAGRLESFVSTAPSTSSSTSPGTPDESSADPDSAVSAAVALAPGEVLGAQRTLVTFVNFANDRTPNYAPLDRENEILNASVPTSAAAYVSGVSYGRASLTLSPQFVDGQFEAPYDDTNCLVRTDTGTQQLIDYLDNALDFSQVDRWIILIPHNTNCGFVGLSTLGKWTFDTAQGTQSFSRIILNGRTPPYASLVAHELGHSFGGLQHSLDWECGTETIGPGCTGVNNDRYDVMAASADAGHYTPSGKQALEWFDFQITNVTGAGGTYLLEPYETTGTGVKALRITANGPYDDYRVLDDYWVSYRKPIGFDAGFSELATDGAMLHLGTDFFPLYTTEATGPSLLLDAKPESAAPQSADSQDVLLEPGQSFVDAERGITIETLGTVGTALEVNVSISQFCGNGLLDPAIGEVCDGTDLGTETCASLGRTSGALNCDASCSYDVSACGPEVCAPGDTYDLATGLCTAVFLGAGPVDMGLYRNASSFDFARTLTTATLLTAGRGFLGLTQNAPGSGRHIIHRLNIPFDTQALPDGATIDSATLRMKYDLFGTPYSNSHPESADDLVLVQTSDPEPTVRALSDYGAFIPVDNPPEGAPRIDLSETYVSNGDVEFPLNTTGLSWIDDQGYTLLGIRTGWDVDDVEVPLGEELSFRATFVAPDSPVSGPRLEVTYHPAPEPGVVVGLGAGLAWLLGMASLSRRPTD